MPELYRNSCTFGFKPYYNWITFNTLLINSLSKLKLGFKPYYNWITFNTEMVRSCIVRDIMSFKPYYNWITFNTAYSERISEDIPQPF